MREKLNYLAYSVERIADSKKLNAKRYPLNAKTFWILICSFTLCILHFNSYALDETAEKLKLIVGEIKIIEVHNPTRIVVGNPDIVDVVNVTKSEMTLSPKAPGSTTLMFWDNFGEQSYKVKVSSEDMDEVKQRADYLLGKLNLPDVYTQTAEDEGKVMLLGKVKNSLSKERINVALASLKDKLLNLIEVKEEEAAVEIDVQILELNKGATNTLGFTWPGSINIAEKGTPGLAGAKWSTLFQVTNFQRATVSSGAYTIDPFTFRLDALIQEGKARVLSRPRLACQSGKEAEMLVGGEKPIFTTTVAATTGAQGTTVEYKQFGIRLNIKPTVTEDERIKLALNVEVSDVGEAETIGATSAPTAKAYPLTKRTASTELYLNNGQTMAIGGLIKQKTEETLRKFPWLADVPVLGLFFRQKTTTTGKGAAAKDDTELFITLTPIIAGRQAETPSAKKASATLPTTTTLQRKALPVELANYANAIQTKIVNALYYPRQAKEAGWEGNVTLSLNITSSGYLKETKIAQSSGYKLIDEAALEIAANLAPYPPFPPQIESQELWIDVPIQYKKD